MVRLVVAAGTMAAISIGIAWIATLLFSSLLVFGESPAQTVLVFGFYVYCVAALVAPSQHKLFYVFSIPVLTQFLHLFQRYDFPAGANSLWRLLPFIFADLYILSVLIRFKTSLTRTEKSISVLWVVLNLLFIIVSPNLPGIVIGAFVLTLITVPLYFFYLNILSRHPSFQADLERSLCLAFLLLAFGTFGLVYFGAQYKGASNLLVTRNISDTNVTMAYFILLWPFAIGYARRSGYTLLWTLFLVLLFAAVVILSFSRGAVFIVLPYMLLSLFTGGNLKHVAWFVILGAMSGACFSGFIGLVNADLIYSWQLRFADLQTAGPVLQKLQEGSGRIEIHRFAYQLFLESPLYGHGTGSFELLGPGYREAHSMFFTILAEHGLTGMLYFYGLFLGLGQYLFKTAALACQYQPLLTGICAYLLFIHSVGFVFVIIPAKSLTINCIAPLLLICIYYYAKSIRSNHAVPNHG